MKRVTFIVFFCLGVFTCSSAQTKQESIQELFHLMKDDSTSRKMMETIMPMFTKKANHKMDSTAKAKSQESMQAMMKMVKKIIAKVKEDKLKLYDRYYSQEEINDLIAFYKSPAGRKYVKVTPEITKEIVMKVVKEYLPEMEKEKKAKQKKADQK